jgi:hypothetical protein
LSRHAPRKFLLLLDWNSRLEALGTLSATRDSKMEILADVAIFMFPDSLVRVPAGSGRAAQGFCRFPGLDSTEAERLSGESRLPLLLSNVLLKST